jgi:predicted phosphodiesterase
MASGGGLLQISDPHFGTEQPQAVQALVRLVHRLQPLCVLLSGDITQRATARQFAAARAFVQRLQPVPVRAVPGNHDLPLWAWWLRLTRPYGRYRAAFGPQLEAGFSAGGWQVLMLNTTRPWRHKHGEVSGLQVAATARWLRAAPPAAVKVVVTHQPLVVPLPGERGNRLRGAAPALAAWGAAGADLLLSGHIHLPCLLPLAPWDPLALPHPARSPQAALWSVQAGTAVSTRVRHGTLNSVTELLPAAPAAGHGAVQTPARGCRVRFWEWAPGWEEFQPLEMVTLPLIDGRQPRP